MKLIPLSQGQFAKVDDDDFEGLSKFKWCALKNTRGDFYAARSTHPGTVRMHRIILGLTDPKIFCDHINHNGLDNRRENLRVVTNQQNSMNRRGARRGSSSGIRGVTWHKRANKWVARIKISGMYKHLGVFSDIGAAKEAYAVANRTYFGEFGGLSATGEGGKR